MKRMLFNATHSEELRVAIVDGQKLLDLDIESSVRTQKKGNIYKAKVTRVEPSLEAAFVDYGAERQGFLPLKEISRAYFTDYSPSTPMAQVKIQDVIKENQELLVQVEKDERGNKGAALTTFISLAGRFLVLMPNNPKGGGISRRIEGEERSDLRSVVAELEVPTDHALIARTAGIGKSQEEMQWDLDYLLQLWNAISQAGREREAPFLVYQESNLVVRAMRDYLRSDISEIMIDDEGVYQRASKFMQQVMPHNLIKLKHYQDPVPLFSRFQIEHQIEAAFSREVRLPSGGAIIIDHTEAIITIDVNSAKSTKGEDIEDTALQTNLEAVDEIARQLRIRDIGGLIVIDLIDMTVARNQRTVESRLHDAVKVDRARVQIGRISRFGMLEMSRQRLRSSIGEANYQVCPRCDGSGHIRSVPSSALSILRIIEEEALKENTEAVHAHLPSETATFLLNEKRHEINVIESRLATRLVIIPTDDIEYPHFSIQRVRSEDLDENPDRASYKIRRQNAEPPKAYQPPATAAGPFESPSVTQDAISISPPPVTQAPAVDLEMTEGFIKRLWKAIAGEKPAAKSTPEESPAEPQKTSSSRPRRRGKPRTSNQRQGDRRRRPPRRASSDGGDSKEQSTERKTAEQSTSNQSQNRRRSSRGRSQGAPRSRRPRGGARKGGNEGRSSSAAANKMTNPRTANNDSRAKQASTANGSSASEAPPPSGNA